MSTHCRASVCVRLYVLHLPQCCLQRARPAVIWHLCDGPGLRPQGGYDKDQPGLASPGARSGAATWHPHAQPAANGAAAEPQAWTSRLADVPAKPPAQPAASDAPASRAEPGASAVADARGSAAPRAAGPAPVNLPAPSGSKGAPAGKPEPSAGAAAQVPESALPPAAAPKQLASGTLGGGGERSGSPAQEPGAAAAPSAAGPGASVPAANGGPAGRSPRSPGAAQEHAERAAAPSAAAPGGAPGRVELWGSEPGLQDAQAALAPLGPAEDRGIAGNGAPVASPTWATAGGAGFPAAAGAAGPPWPGSCMRCRVMALLKVGTARKQKRGSAVVHMEAVPYAAAAVRFACVHQQSGRAHTGVIKALKL